MGLLAAPARLRLAAPLQRRSRALWAPVRHAPGPCAAGPARRVLAIATALAVVGASGQAVLHLVDLLLLDGRFDGINADVDTGVFTWAGASATFGAAVGALLLAAAAPAGERVAPATLAGIAAFFSLDDAIGLHERITIERIGPIEHAGRILWVLAYLPLLALAAGLVATVLAAAPRALARMLVVALGLLVGAVLLEFGSPALFALGLDHGDLGYELEVVVEEGAELAAWTLAAGALAAGALRLAAAGDAAPRAPRGAP